MAEAGEYFWLRTIVFITGLFEHFKTVQLRSDGWIFCCERFVSCHYSLIFARYVYAWLFFKKKERRGVVFYAKASVLVI